jgi:hypothetical protein
VKAASNITFIKKLHLNNRFALSVITSGFFTGFATLFKLKAVSRLFFNHLKYSFASYPSSWDMCKNFFALLLYFSTTSTDNTTMIKYIIFFKKFPSKAIIVLY